MRQCAGAMRWPGIGRRVRLAAGGAAVAAALVVTAAGPPVGSEGFGRQAEPGPDYRPPPDVTYTLSPAVTFVADSAAAADGFKATVSPVTRAQVRHSWREGCPVHYRDLRLIRADHWGFDGREHQGALVVHRTLTRDMVATLGRLHADRYPVARMQLVDVYRADDDASMAANNTSAFNCRPVAGTNRWSEHSYGRAIDVNPVQNPYVSGDGEVSPPNGARFANRSLKLPGMIHAGDRTVAAFAAIGWEWGGTWTSAKDYQHFSSTGR
jgi:hypothetical protein